MLYGDSLDFIPPMSISKIAEICFVYLILSSYDANDLLCYNADRYSIFFVVGAGVPNIKISKVSSEDSLF